MKHLSWLEIIGALEKGREPEHLGGCAACRERWNRAQQMFATWKPEEQPDWRTERLVERILTPSTPRRPLRPALGLRWAWVGVFLLLLGGSVVFWQQRQTDLDRQFASVLAGDLADNPAGLDALLPREYFSAAGTSLLEVSTFITDN